MIKDDKLDVQVNLDSQDINRIPQGVENKKSDHLEDIQISLPETDAIKYDAGKYSLHNIPGSGKKEDEKSTQASTNKKRSVVPLCSWDYWQQWTNVTQIEVKDRIVASLNPVKPVFKIIVDNKPDVYGPFWLATLF